MSKVWKARTTGNNLADTRYRAERCHRGSPNMSPIFEALQRSGASDPEKSFLHRTDLPLASYGLKNEKLPRQTRSRPLPFFSLSLQSMRVLSVSPIKAASVPRPSACWGCACATFAINVDSKELS